MYETEDWYSGPQTLAVEASLAFFLSANLFSAAAFRAGSMLILLVARFGTTLPTPDTFRPTAGVEDGGVIAILTIFARGLSRWRRC